MLKIKDNVDLKELEKFGFEEVNIDNKLRYEFVKNIRGTEMYNIKIDNKRIIHYNIVSTHNELSDTIYDLIEAGVVEKI